MADDRVLQGIALLLRNRCSMLLGALCLVILLAPVLADQLAARLLLSLCLLAVMFLAVWALRVRRLVLWLVGLLALVAAAAIVAERLGEHGLLPMVFLTMAAFMAAVAIVLLHYVLDWHPISVDKVFGAVAAYVLIAFTFAGLFNLLQLVQPGTFHVLAANRPDGGLRWPDMMYFSFTVLTSTGFGEITPVSGFARSLIVIEQVMGVMYVAFLIARVANLYGQSQRPG